MSACSAENLLGDRLRADPGTPAGVPALHARVRAPHQFAEGFSAWSITSV